jgi:hypothetical protein
MAVLELKMLRLKEEALMPEKRFFHGSLPFHR